MFSVFGCFVFGISFFIVVVMRVCFILCVEIVCFFFVVNKFRFFLMFAIVRSIVVLKLV